MRTCCTHTLVRALACNVPHAAWQVVLSLQPGDDEEGMDDEGTTHGLVGLFLSQFRVSETVPCIFEAVPCI